MTDRLNKLENELKRLNPAAMPQRVESCIAGEINAPAPLTWSDRFLIFTLSSGAVAACIIVSILLAQSPLPSPSPAIAVVPKPPETLLLLARADDMWFRRLEK